MDNKAFERAKAAYGTGAYDDATLEYLFPELKESDDEKVRKEIGSIVKAYRENCIDEGTHRFDDCLSWLEKQKEQKPVEINVKALLAADRLASAEMTGRLKERSEILENPEKYGLQKPAWSEEDKRKLNRIYEILGYAADDKAFLKSKRIIGDKEAIELQDFLKSLHPRWRPSEEQMKALQNAVALTACDKELARLYNQLKKLMED